MRTSERSVVSSGGFSSGVTASCSAKSTGNPSRSRTTRSVSDKDVSQHLQISALVLVGNFLREEDRLGLAEITPHHSGADIIDALDGKLDLGQNPPCQRPVGMLVLLLGLGQGINFPVPADAILIRLQRKPSIQGLNLLDPGGPGCQQGGRVVDVADLGADEPIRLP